MNSIDNTAEESKTTETFSNAGSPRHVFELPSEGISLEALEVSLMEQALTQSSGNQTRAAKLLGLTRDQFRYRWKKIRALNATIKEPKQFSETDRLGTAVAE